MWKEKLEEIIELAEENSDLISDKISEEFIKKYDNYVVFGASAGGAKTKEFLDKLGKNVVYFVDNDINKKGFKGKLYSGFEWVILRDQFLQYKNKPKPLNKKLKIFVAAGASDPKCITPLIAKALNNLNVEFEALIVIGALFSCKKNLDMILKKANYDYKVFQNVDNMAEIMHMCDFAICSFGTSAYELACVGVPAIYLCISKDHSLSASMLEKRGFAINLG
ncbi:MAG: hypothetical protein ACP5GK_09385, partial [Desulfurella sp.]